MKIVKDVCGNEWLAEITGLSEIVKMDRISYFYKTAKNTVALMLSGRECLSVDMTYEEFVNVLFAPNTITLGKVEADE